MQERAPRFAVVDVSRHGRHRSRRHWLAALVLAMGVAGPWAAGLAAGESAADPSEKEQVAAVLDDFHAAASAADEGRYFGHLAPSAIFLGTDASERWTRDEFHAYVRPYFSRGQGWTYRPLERHIYLSADGRTAWFDEALDNAKYGRCRGSGALQRYADDWKIEQYHLTIPVPNELAAEVVDKIRALGSGQ